jgi:hypothetical protein
MTAGSQAIHYLPTYIPPDVDMNAVMAAVAKDGVSAPAADVPALRQVVADAKQKGIDLKIVVIETNPPIDTPLRDIASQVGQANPGSTVLAISPGWAGTYSPKFDRVTLEAGQDLAKTGNAVQSSQNFLSELTTPHFPWTAFTIAFTIGVAVAVVAARALAQWARRSTSADTPAEADN